MIYVELSKKQSAVSSQRSDWNAMIYSGCEKNETQGTQRRSTLCENSVDLCGLCG